MPLSSPPTEIVPAASMVDIYIYIYIQKLTCFYSLIWQAHAFTKKVTTFYSKKGELGNKARGVKGV